MRKAGNLYSFILAGSICASPLVMAAEQQPLEKKIASEIPDIKEEHILDSCPRILANHIKEIRRLLAEVKERKITASKEYAPGTTEEHLRTALVLETRSLTWIAIESLRGSSYREEFSEPILAALSAAEKVFEGHACAYPLRGRQKIIAQLLSGREPILATSIEPIYHKNFRGITDSVRWRTKEKGYTVPQPYQRLQKQTIESWEHWSNNYTRLDEISLKRKDCVPPEYLVEQEKVARR